MHKLGNNGHINNGVRVLTAPLLLAAMMGAGMLNVPGTVANAQESIRHHHEGLTARYHLTTKDGWSNDLQTIAWNERGQYYDIYFLHSADGADDPLGPAGQDWMHTTTRDFVHFTEQRQAVAARGGHATEGWKSAWTGSVIENTGQFHGLERGAKVAYISGLKKSDGSQNVWAVASRDNGATFTDVLNDGTPVLDSKHDWTSANATDERDPYVFTWNGKTMMYVAEGDDIGVYLSTDGVRWQKADKGGASKITSGTFFRGRQWAGNAPVECPVIKTMTTPSGQHKQVLFFGAKDASAGETTGTYYVVGHLDNNGLFAADSDAQRLDQGSDYYGANVTGATDIAVAETTVTTMGWIGNWNYTNSGIHADEAATSPYLEKLGSYSLARTLTLGDDGRIRQKINTDGLAETNTRTYRNVTAARPISHDGKPWVDHHDTNDDVHGLYDLPNTSAAQRYDLDFSATNGDYTGRIYIDIWQGGDWVRFNYDPSNGWYNVTTRAGELDNGLTGQDASLYYYNGLLGDGRGYSAQSGVLREQRIKLQVFTDTTSVEFVFPNGQTYTVARFSSADTQDFKIFTEDPSGTNKVDIRVADISRK